uniref:RING-type E3 ubiquitin transferase n=1 Tax=Salmo trutta TaxID=8032 RepID=A0A674B7H5_SALTR
MRLMICIPSDLCSVCMKTMMLLSCIFPLSTLVNVMRCIVCCQDCKQSDIIDNYFVKDTTEASNTSDEKSAQMCTSCEDNADTIGFCAECGEWLCKTCIEAHQRVKITKDHKIRKKEDVSEESVGASGQRPVFCPIHKQEPLKLFCETCDTLTCRDCQLLEHKEHRYQFLEEAFQNQKGFIETHMAKLQEKKTYVHYSHAHVTSRYSIIPISSMKVEHEIKIAVFTLINEINKKGKCLLQQLESVTKERSMKLFSQQTDIANLARQILHVLNFTHSAINSGSSTALLYSKRLIIYQLRKVLKAGLEPVPQANGSVRFFCDPTFWAKNVVNLGNLVIEKMPQAQHPPNIMVGPISPGHGHPGHGKHPGQINLAQLRLQHMQQQAFAQQKQQQQQHQQPHQQQQQHQQRIQEQMRIASQMSQQHPRQGGPSMVQQQVDCWGTVVPIDSSGVVKGKRIPEISWTPPLPVLGSVASASSVQDTLKKLGEHVKTEPQDQEACSGANGPSKAPSTSPSTKASDAPLTNSKGAGPATLRTPRTAMGTNQGGAGGKDDDPNEDWCAVCNNGGELLCCDRCPKVFHITCHIPTLKCSPSGEWMCTFCRSLASPEMEYEPDDEPRGEKDTSEQGLSPEDQRRCERLLLNVFCHELSEGFQEPVPPSIPNYYKIIKKPMDLTLVKQKLQLKHVQHYQSPIEFVSDVRLVFSNCAKYNEADSEVAQAGKAVSLYFEERLLELYPDESFPEVPEEPEAPVGEEADLTEDSEDEFVQPKRKRLKTDEKMLHIK